MRPSSCTLAGLFVLVTCTACGDEGGDEDDGLCAQEALLSCVTERGDRCNEFYTPATLAQAEDACRSLGRSIDLGPCPSRFRACCYDTDGSWDDPEGYCEIGTAEEIEDFRERCELGAPVRTWCPR